MSDADRAHYNDLLKQCATPPDAYAGKDVAAGAADLLSKLDALVADVLTKPGVAQLTSGYAGCLSRAGYPGVTDPAALRSQLAAKYPATGALAAAAMAAAADNACRIPIFNAAVVAVAAALPAFSSANAAALNTVEKQWQAIVTAANADA
jgi:hypothetical protein